eukprot:6684426-Lingulodinium_polyedra.AAC.1
MLLGAAYEANGAVVDPPGIFLEDGEAPFGPPIRVVPHAPAAWQGPDLGPVRVLDRVVVGLGGQELREQPE